MNKQDRETGFFVAWLYSWAGLGLGIGAVVFITLVLFFQPVWLGFQRTAYKQSHQYVEAKESMLLQWIAEYGALEAQILDIEDDGVAAALTGQQASLLDRIRLEADRVPSGALPAPVTDFLNRHPREIR